MEEFHKDPVIGPSPRVWIKDKYGISSAKMSCRRGSDAGQSRRRLDLVVDERRCCKKNSTAPASCCLLVVVWAHPSAERWANSPKFRLPGCPPIVFCCGIV